MTAVSSMDACLTADATWSRTIRRPSPTLSDRKSNSRQNHEHYQRIPHWIIVDAAEHIENLHGNDLSIFKDGRRAEICERLNKNDSGSSKIAGQHEWKDDTPE